MERLDRRIRNGWWRLLRKKEWIRILERRIHGKCRDWEKKKAWVLSESSRSDKEVLVYKSHSRPDDSISITWEVWKRQSNSRGKGKAKRMKNSASIDFRIMIRQHISSRPTLLNLVSHDQWAGFRIKKASKIECRRTKSRKNSPSKKTTCFCMAVKPEVFSR